MLTHGGFGLRLLYVAAGISMWRAASDDQAAISSTQTIFLAASTTLATHARP